MKKKKIKKKVKKREKKKKVPFIYLDTNTIRKLIEKKPALLINLMRTVKDRKWKCFTSVFGVLELSDLKKDDVYLNKKVKEKLEFKEIIRNRYQKKLNNKELREVRRYMDNKLFNKYPAFSSYQIPTEVWIDALTIALISNLHSKDAIHLAAALIFKANVLITLDSDFIKEANIFLKKFKLDKKIKVISPKEIFDSLVELGFNLDKT